MSQSITPSASVLSYASPGTVEPPQSDLRRVMVIFWLVPLGVGVSILMGWVVTQQPMFPLLGLFWIAVGSIMALIGWLMLVAYLCQELYAGKPPGAALCRFFALTALLLSNFPAAWCCMMLAEQAHRVF